MREVAGKLVPHAGAVPAAVRNKFKLDKIGILQGFR
jgi:hypothetical protein